MSILPNVLQRMIFAVVLSFLLAHARAARFQIPANYTLENMFQDTSNHTVPTFPNPALVSE
jgi:hypothetical protein